MSQMRYHLLPKHRTLSAPLAHPGVITDQPRGVMDVAQDVNFRNHETAEHGVERPRAVAEKSNVITGVRW